MAICPDCCAGPMVAVMVAIVVTNLMYFPTDNGGRLDCTVEANGTDGPPGVTWQRNGQSIASDNPNYTQTNQRVSSSLYIYSLTTANTGNFLGMITCGVGDSERSVALREPTPPRNVRATEVTATSLTIVWDPPNIDDSNGNSITSYRVTYYPSFNEEQSIQVTISASNTSLRVQNLSPHTEYTIFVTAVTVAEGVAETAVERTLEAAPTAPTITSAFNTSSTSIYVEWAPPENPNGIIRGYRLTYVQSAQFGGPASAMTLEVGSNETSLNITGLDIFTLYSVYVEARTVQFGDPSSTVNVTTDEDAPSAPVITRAVNISSTSILVEWNRPSFSNGIIRQYQITYYKSSDGVGSSVTRVVSGMDTSVNITGLEIFTTYTIYVQALTIELGEASEIVNVTTNRDSVLFQLRLINVGNCSEWISIERDSKLEDVDSTIVSNIEQRCQCGFTRDRLTASDFQCFSQSPTSATYRTELQGFRNISSLDLLMIIERWLIESGTIEVQGVQMRLDSTCTLRIGSYEEEECGASATDASPVLSRAAIIGIAAGGGGLVVLTIVVVIVILIIYVVSRRSSDKEEQ